MIALQISPKIKSLYGLGRQAKNKIVRVCKLCIEFCDFCKAPIWTIFNLKLDWVAFHSVTF